MSEAQGPELLAFIRDVRKLCCQVAELLGTTDKLLGQEGWELAMAQNVAFPYPSSSLDRPRQWFPYEAIRFYKSAEVGEKLAFVSLLLDDDQRGEYKLTEPLVTAGWFLFSTAGAIPPIASEHFWWSRFHGYVRDRRDDGTLMIIHPRSDLRDYREDWYPFEEARTFGVPLVSITSTAVLEQKIVRPLLERIVSPAGA